MGPTNKTVGRSGHLGAGCSREDRRERHPRTVREQTDRFVKYTGISNVLPKAKQKRQSVNTVKLLIKDGLAPCVWFHTKLN